MKIIYEIDFANMTYEIKCKPLSHRFVKYLSTKKMTTDTKGAIKEMDTLTVEMIKETEAEVNIGGNKWSSKYEDFDKLPSFVIAEWTEELIRNSQAEVMIRIKTEKN